MTQEFNFSSIVSNCFQATKKFFNKRNTDFDIFLDSSTSPFPLSSKKSERDVISMTESCNTVLTNQRPVLNMQTQEH